MISLCVLHLAVLLSRVIFLYKLELPCVPAEVLVPIEYGMNKVFLLASLAPEFNDCGIEVLSTLSSPVLPAYVHIR